MFKKINKSWKKFSVSVWHIFVFANAFFPSEICVVLINIFEEIDTFYFNFVKIINIIFRNIINVLLKKSIS